MKKLSHTKRRNNVNKTCLKMKQHQFINLFLNGFHTLGGGGFPSLGCVML